MCRDGHCFWKETKVFKTNKTVFERLCYSEKLMLDKRTNRIIVFLKTTLKTTLKIDFSQQT